MWHSLDIVWLWVPVLIAIYCKQRLIWQASYALISEAFVWHCVFTSSFISVCIFFTCPLYWILLSSLSCFHFFIQLLLFPVLSKVLIHIIFNVLEHIHKCFLSHKLIQLIFSRCIIVWLLVSGGNILFWLFKVVFLHWYPGIWVINLEVFLV